MNRPLIVGLVWRGEVEFARRRRARLRMHMSSACVVVGEQGLLVNLLLILSVIILDLASTLNG